MKRKILNTILVSMVLISTFNILSNLIEIPKVKAQGPPYTIINNPYLNDTTYWIPELTNDPLPGESSAIMNDSGLYLTLAKKGDTWERWFQPWGVAQAYQGYRFHNGLDYDVGKDLAHHIYIPIDIPDNTIIVNVTVKRLTDPDMLEYNFNPMVAPQPLTHFGVGFWYAMKVHFWNDPRVPEHLRGKETYLGWLSPDSWNCPNMFIQEFFIDGRFYNGETGKYGVISRQDGNENLFYAFPGFLGSSQDWDYHSNLILNHTDNTTTTFTIDLGKMVKEFVNMFQQRYSLQNLLLFGFMRAVTGYGGIFPNVGHPDGHAQLYDVVGFTLLSVAPTMEVVCSKISAHYSWLQIYDYRTSLTVDPDFENTLKLWKWMKEKDLKDPFQEHWMNALIYDDILPYMNLHYSHRFNYTNAQPITDGSLGGSGIVQYINERFNLSAGGVWGKAGVEYLFKGADFAIPYEATIIQVKITQFTSYVYIPYEIWSNAGFYIDYAWGKGDQTLSSGEIIFYDSPDSTANWRPTCGQAILNFSKSEGNDFWFKFTPHVEAWWSFMAASGLVEICFDWQTTDIINYDLRITINNSSYGTTDPAPGTYSYQTGTSITISASPNSGHYFSYWNVKSVIGDVDVNYTSNPLVIAIDRDYNITAYFDTSQPSPSNYTLQISKGYHKNGWVYFDVPPVPTASLNGTSIPSGRPYNFAPNTYIQLSASVPEGYKFYAWYLVNNDSFVYDINYSFTLTSDNSLYALWVPPSFYLRVKDDGGNILNDFEVYDSYTGIRKILNSGVWCVGTHNTRTIWIFKNGYYTKTMVITPDATNYPNNIINVTLQRIVYSGGGDGSGCPTMFVWDGIKYVQEGILNIHAESDITVQHEIQNSLAVDNGVYQLQLRELDEFTSHIDRVKLYAVDYQGKRYACPLIYAEHIEFGNVTWQLFFDDEIRVDLKPTQIINLKFLQPLRHNYINYFIFEINGYNAKTPGLCKIFTYNFIILNATEPTYKTWNGLLEIYPYPNSQASLTLKIHYETTYPIIEIYAENVGMVKFNTTEIYNALGCQYFNKVKSLTGFFGLSVDTTKSLTLDFQLPWKPGSIWKMTPELELPGIRLTNWQWINNRILLTLSPGDPELSFLVQSYIEQTKDVVWQFMVVILMLVMLFVALKFIRDKF